MARRLLVCGCVSGLTLLLLAFAASFAVAQSREVTNNTKTGKQDAGPAATLIAAVAAKDEATVPKDSKPAYRLRLRQQYLDSHPKVAEPVLAAPRQVRAARAAASLQPTTIQSANDRLDVTLNLAYQTVQIGNDNVHLRTYNGKLVGPVLRAKAGDTLYITLVNKLPLNPPEQHGGNGHHEWNTTNLHFHGLHVAPQGQPDAESDNVLLALKPSDPFDPAVSVQKYQVKIPANHVAGTFWYHSHKHGSTCAQVSSGVAGALIIERDDNIHNLDSVPEIAAAAEEIMVLQAIPYVKNTTTQLFDIELNDDPDVMFGPNQWPALKRYITVNGEKIPTITMAPGEVRRLRLVHSGQRESVQLRVERAPGAAGTGPSTLNLFEIAVDGLPTGAIRTTGQGQSQPSDRVLELFPGYRSDVLIQPPVGTSGEFYLVDTRWDTNGIPRPDTGADGSPERLRWVAKIVVTGEPRIMNLPQPAELLPQRLEDLKQSAVTGIQYAFYGIDLPPGTVNFYVSRKDLSTVNTALNSTNAKEFDPSDPRVLTLGKTEKWLVGSRNYNSINVTHPFHIHINPFLITKVNSLVEPGSGGVPVDVTEREIGSPVWRDTLAMKQGYTYELLTRYEDFTGSFVDHCHILDHEDNGMMELVRIDASPLLTLEKPAIERNSIGTTIPQPNDQASALFFVQGSLCPHCMTQLTDMATKLSDRQLQVAVVSASTEADLKNFPKVPFRLVADPDLRLFKEYGAFDGKARHATIVRDRKGKELLREVGDEPFMDSKAVLASLNLANPRYVIAVRKTDTTNDDYLTWAPTPCQIRIDNGTAGGPDVMVTLTNDSSTANPDAGDVRFATTLAAGATATAQSITVTLKQDGTPVDFFVAGIKASTLTPTSLMTGGRDAAIEIHQGGVAGLVVGTAAVMVRVRKNFTTLTETERSEFLKALAALRDMHNADNDRFEPLVRMHKLAAMGRQQGFDQAHMSSGFFSWHRAFLLLLEREMQKTHPHVALPYWLMDKPPEHFAREYLGNNYNPDTHVSQPEVILAPSNPIYGWYVRFDDLGVLVRVAGDHVTISNAANYQSGEALNTASAGVYRDFRALLESDPHNVGHNNSGGWMEACVSSPADPLFWIFHCHHDHLWAHWQWNFDRFDTTGTDPNHFFPNTPYSSADPVNSRIRFPLGHHLQDKMWPWDETHGQQTAGDPYTTRPDVVLGKFPKAPLDFIWPNASASPSAIDMIDYWGLAPNRLPHGVAYDDTPFGARVNPPPAVAQRGEPAMKSHADVFLDGGASETNRLNAAQRLSIQSAAVARESLVSVVRDGGTSPAIRAKALSFLAKSAPDHAVTHAVDILDDKGTDGFVSSAAMHELLQLHHVGELSTETRNTVHATIQKFARADDRPRVQAIALAGLAGMGDRSASPILGAQLRAPEKSAIPLRQLVVLSRRYPEHFGIIRGLLNSKQDEVVISALLALVGDRESLPLRLSFAVGKEHDPLVRRAAVRSIMSDSPDVLESLVKVATDSSELEDTRAEAAAGVRVLIKRHGPEVGAERIAYAVKALSAIRVIPTSELGKTINLTLETIREVKQ